MRVFSGEGLGLLLLLVLATLLYLTIATGNLFISLAGLIICILVFAVLAYSGLRQADKDED